MQKSDGSPAEELFPKDAPANFIEPNRVACWLSERWLLTGSGRLVAQTLQQVQLTALVDAGPLPQFPQFPVLVQYP